MLGSAITTFCSHEMIPNISRFVYVSASVLSLSLASCKTDSVGPGRVPVPTATLAVNVTGWVDLPDSVLWQEIVDRDTVIAVGLKVPGTSRGVERGAPQIPGSVWVGAIHSLNAVSGFRIVSADSTHLPVVRGKPRDVATLSLIRRLPFVDYVEPAIQRVRYSSDNGCDSGGSGDSPFGGPLITGPNGDQVAEVYSKSVGLQGDPQAE